MHPRGVQKVKETKMFTKRLWDIVGQVIYGGLAGILVVTLIYLIVPPARAQQGPMIEPVCDARMIAAHAPSLTKDQYLEVVDTLEAGGAIGRDWANDLRNLIEEAYTVSDRAAWVRMRCAKKSAV